MHFYGFRVILYLCNWNFLLLMRLMLYSDRNVSIEFVKFGREDSWIFTYYISRGLCHFQEVFSERYPLLTAVFTSQYNVLMPKTIYTVIIFAAEYSNVVK